MIIIGWNSTREYVWVSTEHSIIKIIFKISYGDVIIV